MAQDFPNIPKFNPQDAQRIVDKGVGLLPNFIAGLFVVVLLFTSYYQVESEEVGVITQFGRFVRIATPGLHFKWPLGIERVEKVPVQRQLKQEFGFRTRQADVRTEYESNADTQAESQMLTGDLNVATVTWIVQYKIRDPYKYVFRVRNAIDTFRDVAEATMREVVGDRSVTEVLTVGRVEIQIRAKETLQKLCNRYQIGIEVLQLVLQDVNPPAPVRDSFNEVNQAIQEKERAVNQAWARYNKAIPEARGKAELAIQSAQGYATERVNMATGDAGRFAAVQKEYAKSPRVTRTRLYLEALTKALPNANRRLIVDPQLKNVLPLLPIQGRGTMASPLGGVQ